MKPIHEVEIASMIKLAKLAKERAYAPYSGFAVGAVIKAASGAYYSGCNIENAAFSPSLCAERVALAKAISEGEREFSAIAILSDSEHPTVPCGVCRQSLAEFFGPETPVICAGRNGGYQIVSLEELYPYPFLPSEVKK